MFSDLGDISLSSILAAIDTHAKASNWRLQSRPL